MERSSDFWTSVSSLTPLSRTLSIVLCMIFIVSSKSFWIRVILSAFAGSWNSVIAVSISGNERDVSFTTFGHEVRCLLSNCSRSWLRSVKATRGGYSQSIRDKWVGRIEVLIILGLGLGFGCYVDHPWFAF